MNEENKEVTPVLNEEKKFEYVVGICFKKALQTYFFGCDTLDYKVGDYLVVETIRGIELGKVKVAPKKIEEVEINTPLKPVLHLATEQEIKKSQDNVLLAQKAEEEFMKSVNNLNLDMHLVCGEYTLDATKVIFTYIADERVDFRELLKVLASKLHCRIELRQIGARDRAKSIGGLGPCGLPLCCSTFLSDFEGISINMAKNQLLALNISKLSGQCGKLICCLKYEDSIYSELKVGLPRLGQKVKYQGNEYKITSMNVLSKTMKLDNKEESHFITFEDFFKECTK